MPVSLAVVVDPSSGSQEPVFTERIDDGLDREKLPIPRRCNVLDYGTLPWILAHTVPLLASADQFVHFWNPSRDLTGLSRARRSLALGM